MSIQASEKAKNLLSKSIDCIVLLTYALLLVIQMHRYFYENSFNIYIFRSSFICYAVLILICAFKIFYHLRKYPLYSLLSSNILLLSLWLCYYKVNYSSHDLLSHWPALITTLLLIVSMMQIPTDYIVKTFFVTIGFLYTIRIFMATFLDIPSVITCIQTGEGLSLGFGNHNFPMVLLFFLVLSWIYISRNRKNRLIDAIIILFITAILALLTRSKTSTLLLVITVIVIVIQSLINCEVLEKFNNFKKTLKKFGSVYALLSPLILVFISIGGAIIFNIYITRHPDAINGINNVTFLSRFSTLSYDFAYNHIWLPFQHIEVPPYELYTHFPFSPITGGGIYMDYSDNVCHYLICYYGFIAFSLIVALYLLTTYNAFKCKDESLLIILGLIATFSIMERSSLLYYANPFLVISLSVIFHNTMSNNQKNLL